MATTTKIERKAWQMLCNNNLATAPVNVKELAYRIGAKVSDETMEEEVSAMLLIEEGQAHVLVNADHHPNRQRFSAAHELGHLVLHSSDGDQLFIDRTFFRNQVSSVGVSRREIEANAFAAALLMPERLIEEQLPDDDAEIDVNKMAKKFNVSEEAMTIRLINLDYIVT